MKRPFFYTCFTLISLFLCTGCFDLNEYIFLKKDGSGKFSFVVDMSKMMAMSKMFEEGTATKPEAESDKLNSAFEKNKLKIAAIAGISQYQEISDTINYKFGFSFEFKDMKSLNKALNIVFASDSAKVETDYTYFELKNNTLTRLDAADIKTLIAGSASDGESSPAKKQKQLFDFDMLFSDISYNTTYEFEQKIDSVGNPGSLLSPNSNKVLLTCHPFAKDSISTLCTLKNKIFLK